MVRFRSWVTSSNEPVGAHELRHMVATETSSLPAIDWIASVVPRHYASSERISTILASLGKPAAARYVETKLPTTKRARSGDLGEILGAQYAARELGYRMVTRLRWKDHREMAMRGDDIIGIRVSANESIEFLKGESKSRVRLGAATVTEADDALQRNNGLPSPHALAFISDRLHEQGDDRRARLIDEALLVTGITELQVIQLLFTFSENNPCAFLRNNTMSYSGRVRRFAVGLEVPRHQVFVEEVFTKAVTNARKL